MTHSCRDHTRSQILRETAARAGAGLPAIEPGMPLPAGTGLSRRSFLLKSAGVSLAVYGGLRSLGADVLDAAVAEAASPQHPVLVSVFLDGGADSLSILAPTGDARYATLRPTLALAADAGTAFADDPRLRWSPAAQGLATLHAEGKVSVLPAVGYASANQSHFTSRHFWETGQLDVGARQGWLGRYLDLAGSADNPLQGLALTSSLSPVLATASVPVAAVERADAYRFWSPGVGGPVEQKMVAAMAGLAGGESVNPALAGARRIVGHSAQLRSQLAAVGAVTAPVAYPTGHSFPTRMAQLAGMLASGLPIRCAAINGAGGYDTHAGQADTFRSSLTMTADTLLAFQRDLEARGLADRVLTLVWSEFGRRPNENGSAGTDHGAAGAAFVIGTRAAGTMVGEFPGLTQLDAAGNLRSTTDFRALYSSLLEQWFDVDAAAVLPDAAKVGRPVLVR